MLSSCCFADSQLLCSLPNHRRLRWNGLKKRRVPSKRGIGWGGYGEVWNAPIETVPAYTSSTTIDRVCTFIYGELSSEASFASCLLCSPLGDSEFSPALLLFSTLSSSCQAQFPDETLSTVHLKLDSGRIVAILTTDNCPVHLKLSSAWYINFRKANKQSKWGN